jgi:hypothetical protein
LTRKRAILTGMCAAALAYHPGNKPLFGFVKRHLPEEPAYQKELDIALGFHVSQSNKKGISLCVWAGADPHAVAPDMEYGLDDDDEGYEWAVERAADLGDVEVLRRFAPDPSKVDFDRLYERAANGEVVEALAEIRLPRDMTSIVQRQCFRVSTYWGDRHDWRGSLLAILRCGTRWESADKSVLAGIRMELLRASSYALRDVLLALRKPEVCSPDIYQELTRTPTMQKRMLDLGLIKPYVKPISKVEKARRDMAWLQHRYDREELYEEVWSRPVSQVAKSYRISGVYLGRVCRVLRVPVPPRGYWAKLRSGKHVRRPPLRPLRMALRLTAFPCLDLPRYYFDSGQSGRIADRAQSAGPKRAELQPRSPSFHGDQESLSGR